MFSPDGPAASPLPVLSLYGRLWEVYGAMIAAVSVADCDRQQLVGLAEQLRQLLPLNLSLFSGTVTLAQEVLEGGVDAARRNGCGLARMALLLLVGEPYR